MIGTDFFLPNPLLPNTYLHISLFKVLPSKVYTFCPTFWKHLDILFIKVFQLAEYPFPNTIDDGVVIRKSYAFQAHENPHWQRNEEFQRQWSGNVWAGIIGDNVTGPYSFEENLNSVAYLAFIWNVLPNPLGNVNDNLLNRMWSQQDGAPAHRSRDVTNHLNNQFPNRWIGICSRIHEWIHEWIRENVFSKLQIKEFLGMIN